MERREDNFVFEYLPQAGIIKLHDMAPKVSSYQSHLKINEF